MTLPLNNLKFSLINTEFSRDEGATFHINDAQGRLLASAGNTGQSLTTRTQIKLSNFRQHAWFESTINESVANVDLLTIATDADRYSTGKSYMIFTIGEEGVVGSNSTADPALTVQDFTNGDIVNVVNNGYVTGAGGTGGNGGGGSGWNTGGSSTDATAGDDGGNALLVAYMASIVNNGVIQGGGGGGGGDQGGNSGGKVAYARAGGGSGGGAGYIGGAGGAKGVSYGGNSLTLAVAGHPGTLTAGGAGGTADGSGGGYQLGPPAPSGGDPGQPGVDGTLPGGDAGYYLVGKSYVNGGTGITDGTVYGQVS